MSTVIRRAWPGRAATSHVGRAPIRRVKSESKNDALTQLYKMDKLVNLSLGYLLYKMDKIVNLSLGYLYINLSGGRQYTWISALPRCSGN